MSWHVCAKLKLKDVSVERQAKDTFIAAKMQVVAVLKSKSCEASQLEPIPVSFDSI